MRRRCILAAALLLPSAALHAAEVITLSNGEWRPYLSQRLPHGGVVSRIVSEAFASQGVTVKFVFRPWKRAYIEALQGDVHGSVVWGPGTDGARRAQDFLLSDTVLEGQTVFFHLRSVPFDWQHYADLRKVRIGGTAGYIYDFENLPGIQIDRAANDEIGFRKLLAGRFDIFPSDLHGGRAVLTEHFSQAEASQIIAHPTPYSVTQYHLLLSKKIAANGRYLQLFNRGLKQLRESGKYAQYMAQLDTAD
jgi:polar amino acid transport system substrate-binding protein